MNKKRKVVAFIPIRSKSKSIKHKNIKPFCGKPLVYWNTKALQETSKIDHIHIATDSLDYAKIINDFNFSKVEVYLRDEKNARDNSTTEDVMIEFINNHLEKYSNGDIMVLVQATNPMITSKQINDAISIFESSEYKSMLSCSVFKRFLWSREGTPMNYNPKKRPLRQNWSGLLLENGIFYISTFADILLNECRLIEPIIPYIMPEYTQYEIDEPWDWKNMEFLFRKYILEKKND